MPVTHVNRLATAISNAPSLAGNLTIATALTNYRTFGAAQDGLSFNVAILDGSAWEVRTGCVYTHSTKTLTRGSLEESSAGTALNLSASAVVTETATAGWANDLEARLLTTSEVAQTRALVQGAGNSAGIVQRPDAAAGIVAVAAKAAQTAGTQIVTWVYGDSVGDFLSEYFRSATEQQFGQTGWGCNALQAFVSGGAAITAAASRYDISMTGNVVTVPSGGKTIYSVSGGVRSFTAAAVWLETGPSMGTCKIEIVAADGTTVLATVSASTNCFNVIQSFVKITWTGSVTNGKLLVTGLSGNCTVISQYFGGSAASGVQQWLYTAGGITADGVGAVALASMYDMIAYAQPDVFWYTNRESAARVDAYNGPIILQYRALRPNATIVICGVWAVFGEDVAGDTTSNSWLENERLRYFATQSQAVFVDALKVFPTFAAIRLLDPVYDGTHINVACRMALVSHLGAATGMLSVYGSPEWRSVSNALTRTQNLAVTAVVGLQDAVNVTCDNSVDAYVKIRRWMFFKDVANSLPDALRVYATSGNGQAVMMNSGTAFASIPGNYDANGQWVLVVHPTTGVATIYGRVNGTLKTLTLGTLA